MAEFDLKHYEHLQSIRQKYERAVRRKAVESFIYGPKETPPEYVMDEAWYGELIDAVRKPLLRHIEELKEKVGELEAEQEAPSG